MNLSHLFFTICMYVCIVFLISTGIAELCAMSVFVGILAFYSTDSLISDVQKYYKTNRQSNFKNNLKQLKNVKTRN